MFKWNLICISFPYLILISLSWRTVQHWQCQWPIACTPTPIQETNPNFLMNFQWNTEHWNIDSVSYPSHVPIPRQETNQNFSKMDFQWNKPSENVKQHSCEIGVCRNRVNCRQLQILGMAVFLGFVCILILATSAFEQPSDPPTSTGETVFFLPKFLSGLIYLRSLTPRYPLWRCWSWSVHEVSNMLLCVTKITMRVENCVTIVQ